MPIWPTAFKKRAEVGKSSCVALVGRAQLGERKIGLCEACELAEGGIVSVALFPVTRVDPCNVGLTLQEIACVGAEATFVVKRFHKAAASLARVPCAQ